jgi:hypothetical protein
MTLIYSSSPPPQASEGGSLKSPGDDVQVVDEAEAVAVARVIVPAEGGAAYTRGAIAVHDQAAVACQVREAHRQVVRRQSGQGTLRRERASVVTRRPSTSTSEDTAIHQTLDAASFVHSDIRGGSHLTACLRTPLCPVCRSIRGVLGSPPGSVR